MIISLKLEHFRKHIDRVFNFTDGLNSIRGANEDGKTSLLLAILYALYGVRALPLSLEEEVTWGYPVKNLKVSLTLRIGERLYAFTRGKGGAECNFDGGVVTGQNEVSKFAAELLGADLDRAQKLMFASQKGLAAAMEGGPTALSSYIESLSGMDLFDVLLDECANQLTTGPTTTLDTAIANMEQELAAGEPIKPDTSVTEMQIAHLRREAERYEGVLVTKQPDVTAAADAYNQAVASERGRVQAEQNVARVRANREKRAEQIRQQVALSIVDIDEARIEHLQSVLRDRALNDEALLARKKFEALVYPEVNWDESYDAMLAEIDKQRAARDSAAAKITKCEQYVAKREADIRVKQANKVTSSVCGFCDQDMAQFPQVAQKNADLDAEIVAITNDIALTKQDLETARTEFREAQEDLTALTNIKNESVKFSEFYARYHAYVKCDDSAVPCRLTWSAPIPKPLGSADDIRAELDKLVKSKEAKASATAVVETLRKAHDDEGQLLDEMVAAVPAAVDLEPLLKVKQLGEQFLQETQSIANQHRQKVNGLEMDLRNATSMYELALKQRGELKQRLDDKREERKVLLFNNQLVKKIKAARPIVASKLWAIVLASVSTMFSRMRGENSVVARGADGFTINGKNAKAVSGSTIDLLGMAMRVALLKTFIPECPFFILDEPMAACDDNRSASLLGFVTSCGFDQILLVTHEEISDTAASNLIVV